MSNLVLVDLFKKHGPPNKVLAVLDVDLTLRDTMCTETPVAQRALMSELSERTEGGMVPGSGRESSSIDLTFNGKMPLFGEHFACMRIVQDGPIIPLAPQIDTRAVAENAIELLYDQIPVVYSGSEVRAKFGESSVVYPETKAFAVALVHSLGHASVENDRKLLEITAQNTIESMNIGDTHKVTVGSDAIEIVPKGLDANSPAIDILSKSTIDLIREKGLNKGTAIHTFMSLDNYKNRTPYTFGDSSPDGVAMIECQQYGGGGVWVKNGTDVPEAFQEAVNGRTIKNFDISWDHIQAGVEYLRRQASLIYLPTKLASMGLSALKR